MSDRNEKSSADRREFLKLAGIGALTGGAAMAMGKNDAEALSDEAQTGQYRESEHVKTYYKLARL